MAATEGHDIAGSDASPRDSRRAGFTLVELLVVIAVITIFAGVIGFALFGGGGSTVGLQSSQSIIVGLLTQARSQAILTGRNAALLVNTNSANPDRYLRFLVVVAVNKDGDWEPIDAGTYLPAGCYVVPHTGHVALGPVESGTSWGTLSSTSLSPFADLAVESVTAETWLGTTFSSRGTTFDNGNIIVGNGRVLPPGSEPPHMFVNPSVVRGVAVTQSGLFRLYDDRMDFGP